MKTNLLMKIARAGALLGLAAVMAPAALAYDRSGVNWSITVGSPQPSIVYGPPVYARPHPVYVQPHPVYVHPHPMYVRPHPVYVAPPPMVVYHQPGYGYGKPYRHAQPRHFRDHQHRGRHHDRHRHGGR